MRISFQRVLESLDKGEKEPSESQPTDAAKPRTYSWWYWRRSNTDSKRLVASIKSVQACRNAQCAGLPVVSGNIYLSSVGIKLLNLPYLYRKKTDAETYLHVALGVQDNFLFVVLHSSIEVHRI